MARGALMTASLLMFLRYVFNARNPNVPGVLAAFGRNSQRPARQSTSQPERLLTNPRTSLAAAPGDCGKSSKPRHVRDFGHNTYLRNINNDGSHQSAARHCQRR